MGEPFAGTAPSVGPPEDRLDSWKEIAAYLNRDVTTVQRWEKREGMPVHRHVHDWMGSVYASRAELDARARGRNLRAAQENENDALPLLAAVPPQPAVSTSRSEWTLVLPLAVAGAALVIGAGLWFQRMDSLRDWAQIIFCMFPRPARARVSGSSPTELERSCGVARERKSLAAPQSPSMDVISHSRSGNTGRGCCT